MDSYFDKDHQRKMRTLRSQKDKADAAAALEEAIEAKEEAAIDVSGMALVCATECCSAGMMGWVRRQRQERRVRQV